VSNGEWSNSFDFAHAWESSKPVRVSILVPAEVLVSSTTKDLIAGSGITF